MSLIQTIKESLGVADQTPTLRCTDCGTTFETNADPDSHWTSCPECDSRDVEAVQTA